MSREVEFLGAEEKPRKSGTDAGFVSIVAAVATVSGTLILSMSANDPYWRLFEAGSVPATAYETASDMRAALSVTTEAFGNPDTVAVSPNAASRTDGLTGALVARAAEVAQVPDPVVAQVPALEDGGDGAARDLAPMIAAAPPALADPSSLLVTASITAPLPLVPVPGPRSADDRQAVAALALSPFAQPAAPAQPRTAGSEDSETELALERAQRIDVQRRLALAGFDPRGFDGVFGPNTRNAIADYQTAWGYPSTGYLDGTMVAELNDRTEDAYLAMRRHAAEEPSAAPVLASVAPVGRPERDESKCARRSDGRIIERQSLACDMAGFAEQFITLGRSSLDEDELAPGAAPEQVTAVSGVPKPGVDR